MEADWFDNLIEETSAATKGQWHIAITSEGYNNIVSEFDGNIIEICGDQGILQDGGAIDNANAVLIANAQKMREEIIRLRKLLSASEMVNTHASLDEK